ncbi:hypothetical protein [Nocardia sp. NPDC059239]|uniref:hypothetical protein n=1 Tax=unclassified Nocardia TaxID=2637762 RepID=UPI0036882EE9
MVFPSFSPNEIRTWRGPIKRLTERENDPAPLLEIDTITDKGRTFTRAVKVKDITVARDPAHGGERRILVEFMHDEVEPRSYAPDDEVTAHRFFVNIP